MAEESSIFECVEGIAKLIGLGKEIADILGLGGENTFDATDLQNMLAALLAQSDLQGKMNTYAGDLANARYYFKQKYQANLSDHPIPAQPIDYYHPGNAMYLLNQLLQNQSQACDSLTDDAAQLEIWLTQNVDSLPDQVATGVPLWIDLWIHACLFLSEEGKVSPAQIPIANATIASVSPKQNLKADGTDVPPPAWNAAVQNRADVLTQMRNTARDSLKTIADFFLNGRYDDNKNWHDGLWQKRFAALSYSGPTEQGGESVVPGEGTVGLPPWQMVTIYDARFDGGASTLICQLADGDASNVEFAALIGQVWDWYRWVLWNGDASKDAFSAFINQLKTDQWNRWSNGPDYISNKNSWNDDFLNQSFQKAVDFGNWASGVRKQLLELDLIASGLSANAEDGWSWCEQCGVLFYAASPKQACSAPPVPPLGPHGQQGSGNYVLRCDAVAPLPEAMQMQDGWRRCNNCGELFNPGGSNANVCRYSVFNPTGKSHDGSNSANYVLARAAAPAQSTFAIQDGWRWCNKCGALHYALAKGVCPADGQSHATDGSSDYWLPWLGTLPRGLLFPSSSWHP